MECDLSARTRARNLSVLCVRAPKCDNYAGKSPELEQSFLNPLVCTSQIIGLAYLVEDEPEPFHTAVMRNTSSRESLLK